MRFRSFVSTPIFLTKEEYCCFLRCLTHPSFFASDLRRFRRSSHPKFVASDLYWFFSFVASEVCLSWRLSCTTYLLATNVCHSDVCHSDVCHSDVCNSDVCNSDVWRFRRLSFPSFVVLPLRYFIDSVMLNYYSWMCLFMHYIHCIHLFFVNDTLNNIHT